MDEKIKATLTNLDTWKRGLFMIVFGLISGVVKFIVTLIAIFQFITVLFKGRTNEAVLPFGQTLSSYLYQITLFLTFKNDEMPFPFLTFPDGPPEQKAHDDSKESMVTADDIVKHEPETLDASEEDIKDEIMEETEEKEKKDDTL
jgi:hypothetical protein